MDNLPEEIVLYLCNLMTNEQLNVFVRLNLKYYRISKEVLNQCLINEYQKQVDIILKEKYVHLELNLPNEGKSLIKLNFESVNPPHPWNNSKENLTQVELVQSEWQRQKKHSFELVYNIDDIPKVPFILDNIPKSDKVSRVPKSDKIQNLRQCRFRTLIINISDIIELLKEAHLNGYEFHPKFPLDPF